MNLRHNDGLREKLTAEYVLGTLQGGARRRFETLLRHDPVLRRSVAEWQDRLHPLAEFAPAAQPSSQVWPAIERRLNLHSTAQSTLWRGLRDNLRFWRGLGVASTVLATVLVAVLVTQQLEPGTPKLSYIASLANDHAQTVAIITGDAQRHQLTVKVVAQQTIAADKSLELWAVPKQGAPRSLGLVAANGTIILPLPENVTPQSIPLLAVTLEPKGGSPNPNGPTGPIVFKGEWVQI